MAAAATFSASRHFAGNAWKIGWFDADIGAIGAGHSIEQRQCRTVARVFTRAWTDKHFGKEPH
jgi:hypothetical protein